MGGAVYSLIQVFTVEIMLFNCMCVDTVGQDMGASQRNCLGMVPSSLQGLYQVAAASADKDGGAAMCKWYGDSLQSKAAGIFDGWYANSELAANTVGSFIQDIMYPAGGKVPPLPTIWR